MESRSAQEDLLRSASGTPLGAQTFHFVHKIICKRRQGPAAGRLTSYSPEAWRPGPRLPCQVSSQAVADQVHFRRGVSKLFLMGFKKENRTGILKSADRMS